MSTMYPCKDLLGFVGSIAKQCDTHETQGSMDGSGIKGGDQTCNNEYVKHEYMSAALEQQ